MKEQIRVKFPSQFTSKRYFVHRCWTAALMLIYGLALTATMSSNWLLISLGCFVCFICTIHGFSIAHECSHQNWLRGRRSNFFLGVVMLLPTTIPFSTFKYQHLLHHQKTNDLDYDDAWRPIPRREHRLNGLLLRTECFIRCYCQFLGPLLQTLLRDYTLRGLPEGSRHKYLPSLASAVAFSVVMLGVFWLNPKVFTFGFLIPLIAFHQVLALLGLLHYGAISDPSMNTWFTGVRNSTEHQFSVSKDTVFPLIVDILLCFQNYHVSHHLNPRIPFYYNKMAHKYLQADHHAHLQVQKFDRKLFVEHIRVNRLELEKKLRAPYTLESNI